MHYLKESKTVYIKTFGCQMNVRDSEVIGGLLQKSGYKITEDESKADVVIFNTCSVRQHAEDKVWSQIGRFAKSKHIQEQPPRHGNAKTGSVPLGKHVFSYGGDRPLIGVVGCMAQNYKEQIFERAAAVDFVVGPSDIQNIPDVIDKLSGQTKGQSPKSSASGVALSGTVPFLRKIWETDSLERPEEIYHTGFYEDKEHAYVVISEGCSNYCSYCVVPYVRGPIHHRAPEAILQEIRQAVEKGITKITLLGQNVNAYQGSGSPAFACLRQAGQAGGQGSVGFVKLLEMVNNIFGLKEFSFITSHPKDVPEGLFKAMVEMDKLKKYLHLPVQSGSDKVLKLMNRGYTRDYYLHLVDDYRKIVKAGFITTDIIVGFPSETEDDFQDTVDLVKKVEFDAAYIFKYSVRPHTEAARFQDDVPKEERERRHQLILQMQKKISQKLKSKK